LICACVGRYRRNPFLRHRHVFVVSRDELDVHPNMEIERRTEMTSILKKAVPLAAGLVLLAGSPAFAARHHLNKETRIHDLIAPTYARPLPPPWAGDDNPNPYVGQWLEGYPESAG
jgi:hypothetical protein